MRFRQIRTVYLKELKDILRDRRTLISMILIPILLFPVLLGGINALMSSQIKTIEEEAKPIAVLGAENSPRFLRKLQEEKRFQVIQMNLDLADAQELLRDQAVFSIVQIPRSFDSLMAEFFAGNSPAPKLQIYSDRSEVKSEMAGEHLYRIVEKYRAEIVTEELIRRNIRGDLLEPFQIVNVNTASEQEMGGFLAGMMMPYMIIILTLTGAMYPAIDLTAGEKERGTMETLLTAPIGRLELALGKYFVVTTASILTALLAIASLTFTLSAGFVRFSQEAMTITLTPAIAGGLFMLLLPNAMLFSAILMAIALYARSYKEAQSYISPLMIVVILPAMASFLPGLDFTPKMAFIPVVNTTLMMKHTLSGDFDFAMAALTFLATFIYAGIAVFIAHRLFQKESVLFRV